MIGQIVAHYRILARLGAGGMGEVYKARDTRLDRAVALKLLAPDRTRDPKAKARFVREARAASTLDHPNICTIFEIGETDDDRLFLAMACYEGDSVKDRLHRGPLVPAVAAAIARQIAAGLEHAHTRGVIHRDVKPGNVLLTEDGLVKIVDFGLAVLADETRITRPGATVGTAAYMSPEQLRGEEVDGRTDVWSLGVTLYEMVTGRLPFGSDRAQAVAYAILHEDPAPLADAGGEVPAELQRIITRCLRKRPADRYQHAAELAADLEALERSGDRGASAVTAVDMTARLTGRPYPGLTSFSEEDAGFFHGRDREIEAVWHKLQERPLLAVIGPSGAGKTSFLRAGLVPSRPEGWSVVLATPGGDPVRALRQALLPDLAGDQAAMRELLRQDRVEATVALVARWRRRQRKALLILDQFEELFTLNPAQMQAEFAELIGRLAAEPDTHVLLSLRDDFLVECDGYPSLRPVFQDLTVVAPLAGADLRRALVEPARRCGYDLEDESLVDEMLAEVEGERGALPLLAFAVSQLWEMRDRERRRLTREAYDRIGGVEGALARHAEAVMAEIGPPRHGIVREIFRNLFTAQGTRAIMDRESLLSLFGGDDERAAAEVLDRLLEARLLTSYEASAEDGTSGHRIEIVHESLLSNWPRLVRWRTREGDAAQLRDQLRQAAKLWDQKDRADDLLWTGTAYREFALWREQYQGRLTGIETAFARAMERRARAKQRRRRLAVGSVMLAAVLVAVVTSGLWRRSEISRRQADASARRAEASKLLALAQLHREDDPTEALAYTTASLGLADSKEARFFAQRLLWESAPALEIATGGSMNWIPRFSPDGHRLAVSGNSAEVRVWTADADAAPVVLPGHAANPRSPNLAYWAANDLLVTGNPLAMSRALVWRLPAAERITTIEFGEPSRFVASGRALFAETVDRGPGGERRRLRSWRLPDGTPRELGQVSAEAFGVPDRTAFLPDGSGWLYAGDRSLHLLPLPVRNAGEPRSFARLPAEIEELGTFPGEPVRGYSADRKGGIRIWDFSGGDPALQRTIPPPGTEAGVRRPDPTVRWAVSTGETDRGFRLWDLRAWPRARPLNLRRSGSWYASMTAFHPRGDWLVSSTHSGRRLTFYPLIERRPVIVDGYSSLFRPVAFSPDGRWLATNWPGGRLRLWPVPGDGMDSTRTIALPEEALFDLAFAPEGEFLVAVGLRGGAFIVPLDGSPPRKLEGFSEDTLLYAAAVSPGGQQVAAASGFGSGPKILRVWNLATGDILDLDLPPDASPGTGYEQGLRALAFADEKTLYSAGHGGVRRWSLKTGTNELVLATGPEHSACMAVASDGRTAVVSETTLSDMITTGPLEVIDLQTGSSRELSEFGRPSKGWAVSLAGGVAAAGDRQGNIRVGRLDGEESHLLAGHEGPVQFVAVSPDGRWVASTGEDDTLRLWPMPELSRPPLHALPRAELVATLESLTNLRTVRDPDAPDGWSVELAAFPGWENLPAW